MARTIGTVATADGTAIKIVRRPPNNWRDLLANFEHRSVSRVDIQEYLKCEIYLAAWRKNDAEFAKRYHEIIGNCSKAFPVSAIKISNPFTVLPRYADID